MVHFYVLVTPDVIIVTEIVSNFHTDTFVTIILK